MQMLYRTSGLSRFHSCDLRDMRAAVLDDEDDDGPDGGSPFLAPTQARLTSPRPQAVSRR